MQSKNAEENVLILAPLGQDAALSQSVLDRAGITTSICTGMADLALKFTSGAGAFVIAEEALNPAAISILKETLDHQPPWSDIPIVLLTSRSNEAKSLELLKLLGMKGNINFLERTFRPVTFTSLVQVALRARRRQYEVRDFIENTRLHRELFETAVQHLAVGVALVRGSDLTYQIINPAYQAISPNREILGKTIDEAWPEVQPVFGDRCREVLKTGEPYEGVDEPGEIHRFVGGPLEQVYFTWSVHRVRLPGDEGWGILISACETTKRKQTEERLRESAEDLMRSNKDLEQFAYVSSHDLQEPLRTITNYVDLLVLRQKEKLGDDGSQYLNYIQEGALQAQELVQGLLGYASITKRDYPFEMADLEELLKKTEFNLKASIEENHAEITHDPLPELEVNRLQILQLFQNLISNAIKYRNSSPPKIHVSAREENRKWVFSVKDNGIGIDPQFKDRIFLIFKRLHSKNEYSGTGIGLAICKKIVECHGGEIWLESEVQKGATFYFSLPNAAEGRR